MEIELPIRRNPHDLASVYQPRRVWAAGVSVAWNLLLVGGFVTTGAASRFYFRLAGLSPASHGSHVPWVVPVYLVLCFLAYAAANYPLELWIGYLEERHFGLAKDGIRAWTRDWLAGNAQHGWFFCGGSFLVIALQVMLPHGWLAVLTVALLALFLLTNYFAADLLPKGLFRFESPDAATTARIAALRGEVSLPRVWVFTSSSPRGFCGGIIGMGGRQVMLLSRSTLTDASDSVLRFVLRHDAGHRYYHHPLMATLTGWAWVVLGLVLGDRVIQRFSPGTTGLPPYIAWLGLTLSFWMAAGEPLLAYLGRRLEYQADRFYLRHGGTTREMRIALEELSWRNLARVDAQRRRRSFFHPLPSVWNRLYAAELYAKSLSPDAGIPAQTKGAA